MKARNIFAAATMALASLAAHADLYGTCVMKHTSPVVDGVFTDIKTIPYGKRLTVMLRVNDSGAVALKEGGFPSIIFVTLMGGKGEYALPLKSADEGNGFLTGTYDVPGEDATVLVILDGSGSLTLIMKTSTNSVGGVCEGKEVKGV